MKSTYSVQKKQAWSDTNREKKSRWRSVSEKDMRYLEINVQRIDRPNALRGDPAQANANLRPAPKITNPIEYLTCPRHLMIQNKLGRASTSAITQSILLPPITGSRIIAGKAEGSNVPFLSARPAGSLQDNGDTHLSTSGVRSVNTVFRVLVAQHAQNCQMSNKAGLVSRSLTMLTRSTKDSIQNPDTRSRLDCTKGTFGAQPAVASSFSPTDPLVRQRRNDVSNPSANYSGAMTERLKHDASLCETKQQRDFFSDDSAIKTESQYSEDKDTIKTGIDCLCPNDAEYYTDQRIAEWVLKVNSTLFSSSDDEMHNVNSVEEQDISTIKIIYEGE